MPRVSSLKSLQKLCLENIANNIEKWRNLHVQMYGDTTLDRLDVKSPFYFLRK